MPIDLTLIDFIKVDLVKVDAKRVDQMRIDIAQVDTAGKMPIHASREGHGTVYRRWHANSHTSRKGHGTYSGLYRRWQAANSLRNSLIYSTNGSTCETTDGVIFHCSPSTLN